MSNEHTEAAKIRRNLDARIQELRKQKNLTREGRAARIAKAVEDTRAKLAGLRQAETNRLTSRREELTRKLFGSTRPDDSRIISIRDARDRAAKLKNSDEAAELMTRADMDGDTVLLRAYAEECARRGNNPLERGWGALFIQWADEQYGGTDAVAELRDIDTEFNDATRKVNRDAAFGVGVLPDEIRGVANLTALAAQADATPELPPTAAEQKGTHLGQFMRDDIR